MDDSNNAQPTADAAYTIAGNPVDQNQAERKHAASGDQANRGDLVAARERGDMPVPSEHGGGGQPSSFGYGGAGADWDDGNPGLPNTEAEQMRPMGEGEVAAAQDHKTGFGEQMDLASDLDRKKAEQAEARAAMVQERQQEQVDVAGALGQSGGPAVVEGR